MASPESARIRATFPRGAGGEPPSILEGRRSWEAAMAPVNRTLAARVEAVDAGGAAAEWVSDGDVEEGRAVLFLHGGGYNAGSPRTHRALAARLSAACRARVLVPEYRLAPEHPCPAAVEDAVAAYRWLRGEGVPPEAIAIGGDSAGGGLAAAALVRLRDEGPDLPAGACLLSPWVDLAFEGETLRTCAAVDPLTTEAALRRAAGWYLGGADPRDPRASPLYTDLSGLPPLLVQVGEHEILRSDAQRLAARAAAAGVDVGLEVWPEMWHVWHGWAPALPEAREALERVGTWVRARLGERKDAA